MGNPKIHRLPAESKGSGPWNSRLVPYENDIARWRSERKTYREITELLAAEKDVQVSFSMVQKFVKARSKRRPYEIISASILDDATPQGATKVEAASPVSEAAPVQEAGHLETTGDEKRSKKETESSAPFGEESAENASEIDSESALSGAKKAARSADDGGKVGVKRHQSPAEKSVPTAPKTLPTSGFQRPPATQKAAASGWDSLSVDMAQEHAESAKSVRVRGRNLFTEEPGKEATE